MTKTLRSELVLFLVTCCILTLYLITTNQLFSFDAITNAIACEAGEPVRWFHSNHPLYPFVGVLWYQLEKFLGYTGYSIYSLARLNSVLMASALGLLMWALHRWRGLARAVLTGLFLASMYAMWAYAVDGRAIGASVFCSALVIVWMMKIERAKSVQVWQGVVLGIFSALTVLMHAIAIFHCIPVFVWIFFKNRRVSIVYAITAAVLVSAVYIGCYLYVSHAGFGSSFISWALGYAASHGTTQVAHSEFWGRGIGAVLGGLWLGWRNALFALTAEPLLKVLTAVLSLLLLGIYVVAWRDPQGQQRFSLSAALFVWGLLIMGFLTFWSPGQEGFRLHVLIPWTVMLALTVRWSRWANWGLGLMAAVFFLVNLCWGIFPATSIQNNVGYQVLKYVGAHIRPDSLVLTGPTTSIPNIEVLRPYFFPEIKGGSLLGRLFAFHETSLDPLHQSMTELLMQGRNIYFSDDLFDPPSWKLIEEKANLQADSMAVFMRSFEKTDMLLLPNGRALYRMKLISR